MKLGNSGGKNKGKKYLKITGNETITTENQLKANVFKEWFGQNYQLLKTELISKGTADEDVLNDTFFRLHDKILYGGLVIIDYKSYFHRAYFTNFMQSKINNQKDKEKSVLLDDVLELVDPIETTNLSDTTVSKFMKFAQTKYSFEQCLLLALYLKLGSDKAVSIFTNMPYHKVTTKLTQYRKELRNDYTNLKYLFK